MGRYKRVGIISSSDDAVVGAQGDPPLACRCWISQPRHHSLIPGDHAQDDPRNDRRKFSLSRTRTGRRVARDRVNNPLLYYPHGFLEIAVNAFCKIVQHLDTIDDQVRPVVGNCYLDELSARRFLPINRIVDSARYTGINYVVL